MKKETKKTAAASPTTTEQRAQAITDYRNSGLTIGAFCEKAGLRRSTFTAWLGQAKKKANGDSPIKTARAIIGHKAGDLMAQATARYRRQLERRGDTPLLARIEKIETDLAELRKILVGGD